MRSEGSVGGVKTLLRNVFFSDLLRCYLSSSFVTCSIPIADRMPESSGATLASALSPPCPLTLDRSPVSFPSLAHRLTFRFPGCRSVQEQMSTTPNNAAGKARADQRAFSSEIVQMCFVFNGETRRDDDDVVQYIEEIVRLQLGELVRLLSHPPMLYLMTSAPLVDTLRSSPQIVQGRVQAARRGARTVIVEDILFLIRHDRPKLDRIRNYLSWKDVRKKMDADQEDVETMDEPGTSMNRITPEGLRVELLENMLARLIERTGSTTNRPDAPQEPHQVAVGAVGHLLQGRSRRRRRRRL